jgi:hypothetical protein
VIVSMAAVCAAVVLRRLPFGRDRSFRSRACPGRDRGAFTHLQHVTRDLAKALPNGPPVERLQGENFERQQVQRALNEIGRSAHGYGFHSVTESYYYTSFHSVSKGRSSLSVRTAVNVGGLLVARAVARERETAVRTALGAGWWRLFRLWLVEAAVVAVFGASLGLLLA